MPWSRPTLSQLITGAAADIASVVPGADALLRYSNFGVLGKLLAGFAYLHYGYQDWIAKQAVPFTATDEFLEGWAALKGITRKAALPASGTILFTNCTPGREIAGEAPVVRGDGAQYTITVGGIVDGSGNVTITATADIPGAVGNCANGVVMTLGVAIAGIQSNGNVASGFQNGADIESHDELRARMLAAFARPPQGGAADDYINWALGVDGVTRAWVRPNGAGAGTVIVYFMEDDAEAEHGGFPQGTNGVATAETRAAAATGDQLVVANAIYLLQPVTALVYASAPTNNAVDFTIAGLSGASDATKAAVEAAIADVFFRTGSPGGVYLPEGGNPGEVELSDIESAIAAVPLTPGFIITSPTTNITSAAGALPTLGNTVFT